MRELAFVDALVRAELAELRIPGAVVSIVYRGRVLLARGYGLADLERGTPMDPNSTVVRVGSISKPVTATAVMQLAESGALRLDADVNDYLDDVRVPAAFGRPVTAADLLTHTAGFDVRLSGTAAASEDDVLPLGVYLARDLPPRVRPPGRVLAYSNHGYTLLGHLVETRRPGTSPTALPCRRHPRVHERDVPLARPRARPVRREQRLPPRPDPGRRVRVPGPGLPRPVPDRRAGGGRPRALLGTAALYLLSLALCAATLRAAGAVGLLLGVPSLLRAGLAVGTLGAIVALSLPVWTVAIWRRAHWNLASRVLYSVVAGVAVLFVAFLAYWNLLTIPG